MALPVLPNDFKESIASPNGNFCEKFLRALGLAKLIHRLYSYFVGDDGKLTVEGAAFVCSLNCKGDDDDDDGGGTGTGLTAPAITASDGDYLDRVRVAWNAVAAATSYDVYRNTVNSNLSAAVIASGVTALLYDDTSAVVGTTYYYWVKAKNSTQTSAFSGSNSGFVATELPAITDLTATQGFSASTVSKKTVGLVWTPPAGAARYDIYRHTENNFDAATRIDTNRTPYIVTSTSSLGPSPTFLDNDNELLYLDEPPNQFLTYYYWVVSKSAGAGSVSNESNSASGWAVGDGSGALPLSSAVLSSGITTPADINIPAGAVRGYVVLIGSGAGGAGAGPVYGGGGGGASAVIMGKFTITTPSGMTSKLKVVSSPEADTSKAATATNGSASAITVLKYAADGTTFIDLATADFSEPGIYSAAGGGAGGSGGTGENHASLTSVTIRDGRAGLPGMGSKGGRSGYPWGGWRQPTAKIPFDQFGTQKGDGNGRNTAGSGGNANPSLGLTVEGGKGIRGYAVVVYYAA